MRALLVSLGLGLAALLPAPPACAASPAELLAEADRIRATDPRGFERRIEKLERNASSLDVAQRQHLRLLQNYRRVIRGDYQAAIADLVPAFDEASTPDIKYRTGLLLANTAGLTRDFVTGLRYLNRAMALRDQTSGETRDMGDEVAGTMFVQFGQYELALRHADALLARDISPRARCVAEHIHLEARFSLDGSLDEAGARRAIEGCAARREMIALNLIRATLAKYWASQGRQADAATLLAAAMGEVEATRYTRLILEFHRLLAEFRLAQSDTDAAVMHAARVTALGKNEAASLATVTAHRVLYEVALREHDYLAALRHYRAYTEADKSYLDEVRAREYAFQLTRHELNQKNQSIKLLSNQNQVLRLQQEVARRSAWNLRLAIALLAVIAASAAYWGWRARRMHRNLHQLANTDGLTGLSNRRHFRERTEAALRACEQRARPLSVLLFDLDHFKQINDQCGHSSGDWVLREVARVGRRHCREGDIYGRIGGEEFAMALVDCDIEAAHRIAEQCRTSIAAIDAAAGTGCPLAVAASVGVVSTSTSGYDYETLVAHADAAMYRSKVAGRNRVSRYQAPPLPEGGQVVALDSRNAGAMLSEY